MSVLSHHTSTFLHSFVPACLLQVSVSELSFMYTAQPGVHSCRSIVVSSLQVCVQLFLLLTNPKHLCHLQTDIQSKSAKHLLPLFQLFLKVCLYNQHLAMLYDACNTKYVHCNLNWLNWSLALTTWSIWVHLWLQYTCDLLCCCLVMSLWNTKNCELWACHC